MDAYMDMNFLWNFIVFKELDTFIHDLYTGFN